jgi:hypothetical protein
MEGECDEIKSKHLSKRDRTLTWLKQNSVNRKFPRIKSSVNQGVGVTVTLKLFLNATKSVEKSTIGANGSTLVDLK